MATANRLRGSMDSGEYKNALLGLLFLKYVSDAFEELHEQLKADEVDRDDTKLKIFTGTIYISV